MGIKKKWKLLKYGSPPVLLDLSTKRHFFAYFGAYGTVELQLGQVEFDGGDARSRTQRTYVEHEYFAFLQLLHFGRLLVAFGAHTQQTTQQKRADLDVRVDLGQRVHRAESVAHHAIRAAQLRVDLGAHADETTGRRELQIVLLRVQAQYLGLDRTTAELAFEKI